MMSWMTFRRLGIRNAYISRASVVCAQNASYFSTSTRREGPREITKQYLATYIGNRPLWRPNLSSRSLSSSVIASSADSPNVVPQRPHITSHEMLLRFILDRTAARSVCTEDIATVANALQRLRGVTKQGVVVNSFRALKYIDRDSKEADDRAMDLLFQLRFCLIELDTNGAGLTLSQLCECIAGLQLFSAERREVKLILHSLTHSMTIATAEKRVSSKGFANMLFGLRNMNGDVPEVGELLRVVYNRISDFESVVDPRGVSMALHGLRNFTSTHPEASAIRSLITSSATKGLNNAGLNGQNSDKGHECTPATITLQMKSLGHLKGSSSDDIAYMNQIAENIAKTTSKFTPRQLSDCFHKLSGLSSDSPHVRSILRALGERLEQCDEVMSAKDIAMSLYGLQKMSSYGPEVRKVLEQFAALVSKSDEGFDGPEAANVMLGLQRMNSNTVPVLKLISALSDKMSMDISSSFGSKYVANMLFGLQSLTCESREVRRLLSIIASKVRDCNEPFSAYHIGTSVYGLRWMSCNSKEVRDLVAALTPKVRACNDSFTAVDAVNCFHGLQTLDEMHVEVRDLIGALYVKFANITFPSMTLARVSNALIGLRKLTTNHPETVQLLTIVKRMIASSSGPFAPRDLADSLSGLQGMSSDIDAVREILMLLTQRLSNCTSPLEARDIVRCMYGLKNKSLRHQEVLDFIVVFTELLSRSKPCLDYVAVAKVRAALKHMNSSNEVVVRLNSAIDRLIMN